MNLATMTNEERQRYWDRLNPEVPQMDAVTTVLAIDELTARIMEDVYEAQNKDNAMSMGKIVPYKRFVGYEGVKEVEVAFVTPVGMAAVISGNVAGGPPVSTVSTRARFYVKTQGNSAVTTFEMIINAKQRKIPIDTSRVKELKRAEENYFGQRGWIGDPEYNLLGLHNCPCPDYIPATDVYSITDGQLLENVFTDAITTMVSGLGLSKGIVGEGDKSRYPRKWVMSSKLFRHLKRIRIANTNDRVYDSVLEYIKDLTGIMPEVYIDDACLSTPVMGYTGNKEVFYFLPDDKDKLCLGDFLPFDLTPVQQQGMNFIVYSFFRTSLVIPADPFAMLRGVL